MPARPASAHGHHFTTPWVLERQCTEPLANSLCGSDLQRHGPTAFLGKNSPAPMQCGRCPAATRRLQGLVVAWDTPLWCLPDLTTQCRLSFVTNLLSYLSASGICLDNFSIGSMMEKRARPGLAASAPYTIIMEIGVDRSPALPHYFHPRQRTTVWRTRNIQGENIRHHVGLETT